MSEKGSRETRAQDSPGQPAVRDTYREYQLGSCQFALPLRYIPIKPLGHGAFGVVILASDVVSGDEVAVKCIKDPFEASKAAKRVLREVSLLKYLDHPNVLGLKQLYVPNPRLLCLVTEKMDADLHAVVSRLRLTEDHQVYLMYQLVRAVHYLHSANIVHRDLKPRNILVDSDCQLKVADLGLARSCTQQSGWEEEEGGSKAMTEYVVTRQYRAPEIMLACKRYGTAVDMWSVGCIFAEVLNPVAGTLFPGRDYLSMLRLMSAFLGSPSEEELRAFVPSEKARRYMAALPRSAGADLRGRFPDASPEALDLLPRLLTLNPRFRITAREALCHPYFARVFCEQDLCPPMPPTAFHCSPQHSPLPATPVVATVAAPGDAAAAAAVPAAAAAAAAPGAAVSAASRPELQLVRCLAAEMQREEGEAWEERGAEFVAVGEQ